VMSAFFRSPLAKGDRKNADITIFTMTEGRITPIAIVKNGVLGAFKK